MNEKEEQLGEIILYQPEGSVKLEVRVENETVWLTQAQMAELFQKDRTVIGRHIRNVYKEGELEKSITCANFAHIIPAGEPMSKKCWFILRLRRYCRP